MAGAERTFTVDQVAGDINRLGVRPGAVVMVHASLRRLGPVEGGAAGVVAALDRAVGDAGTVLMVLGARDDFAWVNERPEAEREALLAGSPPFDPDSTPADPEVGTLAEVFRTQPGTQVTNHPEGRFAARGRLAATLLDDPPWDDYFGPGSPLARLVDLGGEVLRLGADPGTVTLLHYAEYLADIPDKRRVLRHRVVLEEGRPVIRTISSLDDSDGIVEWEHGDYFVDILEEFLATGQARVGKVGLARAELFEARSMVDFAREWMERRLR